MFPFRNTLVNQCPWKLRIDYKRHLFSMEPWAGPKKLLVCVVVPPAPVLVSSQRPHAPSVVSVTSVANDKDDNEMMLGAVHRSPGTCLTAEGNRSKAQLGDRLIKAIYL